MQITQKVFLPTQLYHEKVKYLTKYLYLLFFRIEKF